jgi:S-formylglutathione hydrolase FrmB
MRVPVRAWARVRVVTLLAAGGLVAVVGAVALDLVAARGSLLVAPFDAAVEVGGVLLLLAAGLVSSPPAVLPRIVGRALVGAGVAELTALLIVRHVAGITDHVPPTFHLWTGLLGAALGVLSGRIAGRRTALALGAVAALSVGGFLLVNEHYAYYPTVASMVGARTVDNVSLATFRRASASTSDAALGHGVVVALDAPPTVSHLEHRRGEVWLPPAWFTGDRRQLSVLVLLAGTPGSAVAWDRSGLAVRALDQFARQHDGQAPVLVLTDENSRTSPDTECVDGPRGNAETFLTVDVPAFVHDRLGVTLDPARWAVVGFSEGGTCAVDLALRHPDVYGSFVDLAGDRRPNVGSAARTRRLLFGGDAAAQAAHDPALLTRQQRFGSTWGWFAVGRGDQRHVAVTVDLAHDARAAGVRTAVLEGRGGHDWTFARLAFARILPALAAHLASSPAT